LKKQVEAFDLEDFEGENEEESFGADDDLED